MPEGTQPNSMMYPTNCNEKVSGAEMWGMPAFKLPVPPEFKNQTRQLTNAYCFNDKNVFEGYDVWVSSEKTKALSLCCNL